MAVVSFCALVIACMAGLAVVLTDSTWAHVAGYAIGVPAFLVHVAFGVFARGSD